MTEIYARMGVMHPETTIWLAVLLLIMMMTLTLFLLAPVHLVVKEDKTDDFSHLKWNGYIWGRGGGTLLDF